MVISKPKYFSIASSPITRSHTKRGSADFAKNNRPASAQRGRQSAKAMVMTPGNANREIGDLKDANWEIGIPGTTAGVSGAIAPSNQL
jgi:hypothetical protein